MKHVLDIARASDFARIALGHVTREYPNKLDHVLGAASDVLSPRALHPIFYGSFDWHSCVHAYWLLTRLLRRFPMLPEADAIRALVDAHVTPANVAGELAYLARPTSKAFERPYGWAWLLALAAELARGTSPEARRWSDTLAPLADAFVARFLEHLPHATYPVRAGTHANTAFALALASEHATGELAACIDAKARALFDGDRDCQAWEPSGDDFLSPALMEAECMRRVLPPSDFRAWLATFLPRLDRGEPAALFEPAVPSDRTDGKIVHLDGLNLSRAWCLRSLARVVGDALAARLDAAADTHLDASLPHVGGDYMGSHWLATFALLALDA